MERSLTSICRSDFTDFEVILVDDGSIDDSAKICTSFCRNDSRFKYFRKSNGGVASARQFGLENIKGNYIIHIDPDDWIEPDFLSKLYNEAVTSNADMVICDYFEEYIDSQKLIKHSKFVNISITDLQTAVADGTLWGVCWNKLIHKSVIDNSVYFEPDIDFQEDRLFVYRALNNVDKISFVEKPLYHYNRNNPNSILGSRKSIYKNYWTVKRLFLESQKDKSRMWYLKKRIVRINTVVDLALSKEINLSDYHALIRPFKSAIRYNSLFEVGHGLRTRFMAFASTFSSLHKILRQIY